MTTRIVLKKGKCPFKTLTSLCRFRRKMRKILLKRGIFIEEVITDKEVFRLYQKCKVGYDKPHRDKRRSRRSYFVKCKGSVSIPGDYRLFKPFKQSQKQA